MLWVVARDAGDEKRAQQAIREAAARAQPDNWYGHIARYIAGELSQSEFLESAADDGQRCEAYYFVAEKTRLTSGPEQARGWFDKCTAVGRDDYWEHKLACLWLEQQNRGKPATGDQGRPAQVEP